MVEERTEAIQGGITSKVMAGLRLGPVRYGCRIETDRDGRRRLAAEETGRRHVRHAFALVSETAKVSAAQEFLAAETGLHWTRARTVRLLSNPAYLGVQVFGEARREHSHEAIVGREAWDDAQRVLALNRYTAVPRTTVAAGPWANGRQVTSPTRCLPDTDKNAAPT